MNDPTGICGGLSSNGNTEMRCQVGLPRSLYVPLLPMMWRGGPKIRSSGEFHVSLTGEMHGSLQEITVGIGVRMQMWPEYWCQNADVARCISEGTSKKMSSEKM